MNLRASRVPFKMPSEFAESMASIKAKEMQLAILFNNHIEVEITSSMRPSSTITICLDEASSLQSSSPVSNRSFADAHISHLTSSVSYVGSRVSGVI